MQGLVYTHADGDVAVVVLNRPEKRNAMTPEMLELLLEQIAGVDKDEKFGAMVLAGEGKSFCAGFDMGLVHNDAEALSKLLRGLSKCILAMKGLRVPVVVAAHHSAVAGGCALLAGGDIVVTNTDAMLGYPVVKLGISPAVNVAGLMMSVGAGPTRRLTQDPELISGEEALRIGLAQVRVDLEEDCLPRAVRIAKQMAGKSKGASGGARGGAIGATKGLLNEVCGGIFASGGNGGESGADQAFARGLRTSLGLVGSEDQRERVAKLWK